MATYKLNLTKAYIIFPETAWTNVPLGYAGIKYLADEIKKMNCELKVVREFMAVVFEIGKFNPEIMNVVREKLPDNYQIPVLLQGSPFIISKDHVIPCAVDDVSFRKLMQDAQVAFSRIGIDQLEKPRLSLDEINTLCNDFAESEHFPMPLKEFDIKKLSKSIHVNEKKFEHRLVGILEEIKCIWFALDYDLNQLSRNTGENANARFKRYMYINNAIVRIQSIWEKLIGLAILLERPEDFDKILSKKGRTAFQKNFKHATNPVAKEIWDYSYSLDIFGERYRTPELHKIGKTIHWAAQKTLGEEINRFIGYRNDLNGFLRRIVSKLDQK